MLYCEYQFHYIEGRGYPFFMTAAGYSLNAMAFALLVVAALSPGSWLARIRIPGAYHVALWSYSIYLSHKAVQMVLERELRAFELPSIALACIIAVTSVLVGSLLYWLVESPFMALRDRWVPSNFAERRDRGTAPQGDTRAAQPQNIRIENRHRRPTPRIDRRAGLGAGGAGCGILMRCTSRWSTPTC